MSKDYKDGFTIKSDEVIFDGDNDYPVFNLINDYVDEYTNFDKILQVEIEGKDVVILKGTKVTKTVVITIEGVENANK